MSRGGSSPGGVHIVFSVSLERPGFPSLQTAQHCFRASPGGLWRVRAALDRWALWALSRRPCRCLRASPGGSGALSRALSRRPREDRALSRALSRRPCRCLWETAPLSALELEGGDT